MTDLNNDCWRLVANKLEFNDIYNLSSTCKRFKKNIYDNANFWNNKLTKCLTAKWYYYLSMEDAKARNLACKNGDLEMIEFYHSIGKFQINDLFAALEKDNPIILDYVIENGIGNPQLVYYLCMSKAIRRNKKNCIIYLSEKIEISENVIMLAAQYCDLEIMKIIFSKVKLSILDKFALRKTASQKAKEFGNYEVEKYLEGYDLSIFTILLMIVIALIYF